MRALVGGGWLCPSWECCNIARLMIIVILNCDDTMLSKCLLEYSVNNPRQRLYTVDPLFQFHNSLTANAVFICFYIDILLVFAVVNTHSNVILFVN